jgi:hypothetical protein
MAMFRMKHEYVPYAILWILIISVFAAQGLFATNAPTAVNGTFTINTSDGTAFQINDTSMLETASLTLGGNYHAPGANGNIKLRVTSGTITIGTNTYTIQNGNGVYDPATGHIIITARVNVQSGEKGRNLILFGYVSTSYGSDNLGGPVTFVKPLSKLSGAYFLAINANLALS